MRQLSTFLTIVFASYSFFLCGQNSAPEKKWHLAFGVNGAINKTRDVTLFVDDHSRTIDSPRAFKFDGEGEVFLGCSTEKQQILIGFGYADNVTQYNISSNQRSGDYIRFQYKFYTTSFHFNWLIGKKHNWMLGPSVGYALMTHFSDRGYVDAPSGVIDYTENYKTPQNAIWLGASFGKLFALNEHFEIGAFFNTRASSIVKGTNADGFKNRTFDRNFLVYTLNINLTYKL